MFQRLHSVLEGTNRKYPLLVIIIFANDDAVSCSNPDSGKMTQV